MLDTRLYAGCFHRAPALRKFSFLLLCYAALCGVAPRATLAVDYLTQLQSRAETLDLARQRQWHLLLHYESKLFAGVASTADSTDFFLAANGKTRPKVELAATLRAFFQSPARNGARHPQCRFIARYHWLKGQLAFDPLRLPEQACPAFKKWYARINPERVTLIFPAASLNNPASMYGHTLLRVDPPAARGATALSSYALNFAAQTNESNGLMFAVKGLIGFYTGRFAILPYYDKVQSYGDIENRDIWEYDLNFTQAETRMMMMHAWELDGVDFDYYFFDENCSYQLLSLLEAARPSLHLTDQFFYHAIPSDTVRVTLANPRILDDVNFRPSLRTRINWRAHRMSSAEETLAIAIAETGLEAHAAKAAAYDPEPQARILDTAYDLLQYRYNRAGGARAAHARASLELLRLRSRLPAGDTVPSHPAPGVPPHAGHASARADFGIGRLDHEAYAELRIRAAYHDLLDPPAGFTQGAEINMFALALRLYERGSTQLESLELVDILSLSPRGRLFKPWSWQFNVALRREWLSADERPVTFAVTAGGGLSYALGPKALLYALAEANLLVADELSDEVALGAGPAAGIVWRLTPAWNAQLSTRAIHFPGELDHTLVDYSLEQNFALNPDWGLRLSVGRQGIAGAAVTEAWLSFNRYF